MSNLSTSALTDLERGYRWNDETSQFCCLFCPSTFELGVVFNDDDTLRDAEHAMRHHVEKVHGGAFDALLALGKPAHGLSPVQEQVVELSFRGMSDREIAASLGGRSASTVRNHRFQLRKRHREARVFVALMELLESRTDRESAFIDFHRALPVSDERTAITEVEAEKILRKYFRDAERTQLLRFPKKEKHKLVILRHLADLLEPDRRYTERELTELLRPVYDDHVTLRRYLVDYRFVARLPNGSAYWRIDSDNAASD